MAADMWDHSPEKYARDAAHYEARANACDSDAAEYRRLAEQCRKMIEYIKKSSAACNPQ